MVLSHELGHIALGHRLNTKWAFSDRMIFPDEDVFHQIGLKENEAEEADADKKGLELLQKSPYNEKLASAGLFLRALDGHSHQLISLINPHFGNRMTKGNSRLRMAALEQSAP